MDGIGPEMLQITSLVRRVEQEGVQEVILALTPSVEGDTTSLYPPDCSSPSRLSVASPTACRWAANWNTPTMSP